MVNVAEHRRRQSTLEKQLVRMRNEIDRLRTLLDDARICFVPDTQMSEQQVKIRDRVEYAVGATTRDPDTGERRE